MPLSKRTLSCVSSWRGCVFFWTTNIRRLAFCSFFFFFKMKVRGSLLRRKKNVKSYSKFGKTITDEEGSQRKSVSVDLFSRYDQKNETARWSQHRVRLFLATCHRFENLTTTRCRSCRSRLNFSPERLLVRFLFSTETDLFVFPIEKSGVEKLSPIYNGADDDDDVTNGPLRSPIWHRLSDRLQRDATLPNDSLSLGMLQELRLLSLSLSFSLTHMLFNTHTCAHSHTRTHTQRFLSLRIATRVSHSRTHAHLGSCENPGHFICGKFFVSIAGSF